MTVANFKPTLLRHAIVGSAFCLTLLVCASSSVSHGQTPQERDQFEVSVRPLLVKHCIQCHGPTKQEGGLKLTSLDFLLKGGESGPAIVPGKPEESLLIEALRHESLEMPPDKNLEKKAIDGFAQWIRLGAKWPKGIVLRPAPLITDEDRQWWCYQPLKRHPVPQVKDNGWCRNEIDRFIFDRLAKEGFQPSAAAKSHQLLRRVHFGVTGLPPHESSVNSKSGATTYQQLVDELLDSPAYGENQARFWLDLVRYADSDGYNADHARPEAYHYRDYVIRALNEDKSYDQFVLEQLAGDELFPGNRDALIGTMYLRHWIYEWNQRDVEGQWRQILSDVTETTADVFLAQGLKCARCHDHKFDPLLQKDYFAFKAFFAPLHPREDQPIADVETRAQYLAQWKRWETATEGIRRQLHEIERPVLLKHATREGFNKFTKEIRDMISARTQDRTAYEHQIASLASNQFDLHPDKLAEWLNKETEARRQELRKQLASFDHLKPKPLPTLKFVASDVGPVPPPTTIPDTEDQTPIEPAYPVILGNANLNGKAKITRPHPALQSTGRRTALARWIVDPQNPLTARVIVNRIWQQHFGRGLVETTSDFGRLGTPPSHPELLDWLALRFMNDGWSFKKLHRLILNSATYRQTTSLPTDPRLANELMKKDPRNILLWRMNPRRLSAEEFHDCLLAASGELGKGKRAIYKAVKRNKLDPLLATFDFPDRVESQGVRHKTTTSPQALWLMNDPWIHDRARAMARLFSSTSNSETVQQAYQRLYHRAPLEEELQQALTFLQNYESITPPPPPTRRVDVFPTSSLPKGGQAIVLKPSQPTRVSLPPLKELHSPQGNGDFTIEATVLLRSLYPGATVRTIVSNWSNKNTERGWSLGVTSTKSAFKPRNLILQLVGSRQDENAKPQYEVVASNLRLELNKPYKVAVSIDLHESEKGITFYLQDLSKPDAKVQVAQVKHLARWKVQSKRNIEIGERSGKHRWDGLIQNVAIHKKALVRRELFGMAANEQTSKSATLFDLDFSDPKKLGVDRSGQDRHAKVSFFKSKSLTPAERAKVALLHALLCTNEAIYVD